MPTFLATDYLQEVSNCRFLNFGCLSSYKSRPFVKAVGQRRAVLGRMLLSEPEHLEATDSSINKNQDIDKTVIKDWTEGLKMTI